MAGFPIGFPVLGALAGAAWVLGGGGSDRNAKRAAGAGFVIGAGLGLLKMTSAQTSGLGRMHYNPHPATAGRAPWNPPRRYV